MPVNCPPVPPGALAPGDFAPWFTLSLQHQPLPVTKGRRFALLSFFYDEPARQVREANLSFVTDG